MLIVAGPVLLVATWISTVKPDVYTEIAGLRLHAYAFVVPMSAQNGNPEADPEDGVSGVQVLVEVQPNRLMPGAALLLKNSAPAAQVAGSAVPTLTGLVEGAPEKSTLLVWVRKSTVVVWEKTAPDAPTSRSTESFMSLAPLC
jgi:hypothetical protein